MTMGLYLNRSAGQFTTSHMYQPPRQFTMSENHAIVFGASGLIGWAMVNQLLAPYPTPGTFASVTAVANRPIDLTEAHWPEPGASRPDLRLVSGVDLRGDAILLEDTLRQQAPNADKITHVYYFGEMRYPPQVRSGGVTNDDVLTLASGVFSL